MSNTVTLAERTRAVKKLMGMSDDQVAELKEAMDEQRFERRAAFGGDGYLAPAFVEETGEPVSTLLYELCYRARVDKLFEERDNERKMK